MSGHVFISYNRRDRDFVEEVAKFLANADIPVWFDHHIEHGTRWDKVIETQIETCAVFVVVMSQASRESDWVLSELTWAQQEGKKIMPILLEGRPFLPVVTIEYEDLRTGAMPSPRFVETARAHVTMQERRAAETPDEGNLLFEMKAHQGRVLSVAYPAKNAALVASAGPETVVRVWDTATGALRTEIENATWPVSFAPDGSVLASGGLDNAVYLWDPGTGEMLGKVGRHRDNLISIAIAPDGRTLVTGSKDKSECVWDMRTGELVHTLAGRVDPGSPLVFSPDGTWLIAPNAGGTRSASLWEVQSGRLLRTLGGHKGLVHDVTVSWDGRLVATGGEDRTARVWDAQTGEELHLLGLHTMAVRAVAFSPNGHRVATGSTDKSIRLWDATNGAHIKRISNRAGGIYDLAYAPDGQTLASGHGDGAIRIWQA
jgi:WD40 repeat protein